MINEPIGVVVITNDHDPSYIRVWTSIPSDHVKAKNLAFVDYAINYIKQNLDDQLGSMFLTFAGYGYRAEEVYEIEEIRDYVAKVFEKYPYIFYFLTPELDNMNMFLSCLSNVTVHKDLFFGSLSSIVVNTEYPNAPKVRVKIKPSKETMAKIARESTKYAKSIGKLGARFIEHMGKVGVDKNGS